MAYFNYDATHYSTTSTAGGFDPFLFPNMAPVVGERENQESTPLDNYWGMVEQPVSQWTGPSTSSLTLANHDSTVSTRTEGYSLPSHAGQCQWESQPQQRPIDLWEDVSGASGTSTTTPAPDGVPLSPRGNNTSELFTNASDSQNTYSWDQLSIDPTVSQLIPTRWLQIYGSTSTYGVGHANAEAGPSTLLPPLDVGLPTQQPPGGISEMMADAEQNNQNTEEEEAPRSKRRRIPYPRKQSRNYRNEAGVYVPRLWAWVRKQEDLEVPRNFNHALAAAVEVISVIRPVLYATPYLVGNTLSGAPPGTARIERERNRRTAERKIYEDLSKRYPRKRSPWIRMELLAKVVEDLETHPALQ